VIAESDPDVRKIISYALRPYTEEIVIVSDANDALTAIDDIAPMLLFLDLNLPQINACGLLEKLHSYLDDSTMRVIITTAYARRDLDGDVHPACAILQKPFDMATIRAAIDEQLAGVG
jgi:DNA-binding response OmpR family regulator